MASDKNMLRLRIAASKLYKYMPTLYIEAVNNNYYDLLASNRNHSFSFGVKVGGTTMLKSKEYEDYFQQLSIATFNKIKYPVVVMAVNENSEEVKIGIITKVRLGSPVFFRNPRMVYLNENNAEILYDNIKSMDYVIRNLSSSKWGILKKLGISIRENNGFVARACIMYLRPFSEDYKMQQPQISNDKERFERYEYGIPQEEYPVDSIDEVIKDGVQSIFPDAEISQSSSLLLFNTHLDNLRMKIDNYGIPKNIRLQIEPNIDEAILELGFFSSIILNLKLYPQNPMLNNYWHDEVRIISLDPEDWRMFYDAYKSQPNIKTDISQIVI